MIDVEIAETHYIHTLGAGPVLIKSNYLVCQLRRGQYYQVRNCHDNDEPMIGGKVILVSGGNYPRLSLNYLIRIDDVLAVMDQKTAASLFDELDYADQRKWEMKNK